MIKIWIINKNACAPSHGGLIRHYKFKKMLSDSDYDIRILTSSITYNTKQNLIKDKVFYKIINVDGVDFTYIKVSDYKESIISRIKNMFEFAFKIRKMPKLLKEKPDLIYASSPDIFTAYSAMKLAKKLKVPFCVEIRDLWPESIVEYKGISRKNPLIKILYQLEKKLYKRSDSIVFLSEGAKKYIIDKKWDDCIDLNKIYYINNGVDIEEFEKDIELFKLDDSDLNDDKYFKVIYTGVIRQANNIETIVHAAEVLKEYTDIRFLIYGEGSYRASLENYCRERGLSNIVFKGNVHRDYIPYVLSKGDINLLHYKRATTHNYGGSQNKLFEYLASGKPIISTIVMNYDPIIKYNCGSVVDNIPQGLADGILHYYNMSKEDRENIGMNGKVAVKDYDYDELVQRFLYVIEKSLYGKSTINYKYFEGEIIK